MLAENKENLVINQAVLETVAFLDIFDYPPTAMEIWRFLGVKAELEEVIENLDNSFSCHPESRNFRMKDLDLSERTNRFISDKVCRAQEGIDPSRGAQDDKVKNGFYFLSERERPHPASLCSPREAIACVGEGEGIIEKRPFDCAQNRREFFHLAEKKFRIARRAAKILRFFSGVKMAAVCNNFYYRPESDIDLFIIVQKNRLWLTRALVTAALHLFRLRRHGKKITDRVCLSFFITEDSLNLENIALKKENDFSSCHPDPDSSPPEADQNDNGIINDPYLCFWLAFLEPIYGQDCYNKFWEANAWLKKYLPNAFPVRPNYNRRVDDNLFSSFWKKINSLWFNGFLGDKIELIFKKIQLKKMSKNRPPDGIGVVINDQMLKFHENDRRQKYYDQLRSRLA